MGAMSDRPFGPMQDGDIAFGRSGMTLFLMMATGRVTLVAPLTVDAAHRLGEELIRVAGELADELRAKGMGSR